LKAKINKAYYNAGVVAVNLKIVGFAPGAIFDNASVVKNLLLEHFASLPLNCFIVHY
jgi:hypothetical protein